MYPILACIVGFSRSMIKLATFEFKNPSKGALDTFSCGNMDIPTTSNILPASLILKLSIPLVTSDQVIASRK